MKRIELLDYGRLIAAISVIFFHYFFNGIHNGKINSINYIDSVLNIAIYGYLGVEFFFMISGYVIFYSANKKDLAAFVTARILRLYPAFWAGVFITSIFTIFIGKVGIFVSFPQLIANLTMFPQVFGYEFVDGVYWTLQYEWVFYFCVSLILLLGFQKNIATFFLLWPVLMLIFKILGLDNFMIFGGEFNYFAAGAVFAIAQEKKIKSLYLIVLLCLYLCLSFSIEKAVTLSELRQVSYSANIIAGIIVFQFLFFLIIGLESIKSLTLPLSKLAGNLTYPVYLIHAHLGYMLLSHFADEHNKLIIYAASLAVVFVLAYLINLYIEQRLQTFWMNLLKNTIEKLIRKFDQAFKCYLNKLFN